MFENKFKTKHFPMILGSKRWSCLGPYYLSRLAHTWSLSFDESGPSKSLAFLLNLIILVAEGKAMSLGLFGT